MINRVFTRFRFDLFSKFLMPDPPTNPASNLIPICFVILLTAMKQVNKLFFSQDIEINV
jgi:hypothetical protein